MFLLHFLGSRSLSITNPLTVSSSPSTTVAGCSIASCLAVPECHETVAQSYLLWNPIANNSSGSVECDTNNNKCLCALRKYVVITSGSCDTLVGHPQQYNYEKIMDSDICKKAWISIHETTDCKIFHIVYCSFLLILY